MSAPGLTFTVPGTPVPQGSKSAFVRGGRAVVAESNRAKLKPWRARVSDAAAAAMNGGGLLVGPVGVDLRLTFARPKSHYRSGRHSHELRADAPHHVATKPDAEKVARAVADALSGVVFRDDSQVAYWAIEKVYGDPPAAQVSVWPLPLSEFQRR